MNLTEEDVVALIKKWRDALGLEPSWGIEIEINKSRGDAKRKHRSLCGRANNHPAYFRSEIMINLFQHEDVEAVEDTVLHELLHVAMSQLREIVRCSGDKRLRKVAECAEDRVVVMLTNALLKLDRRKK